MYGTLKSPVMMPLFVEIGPKYTSTNEVYNTTRGMSPLVYKENEASKFPVKSNDSSDNSSSKRNLFQRIGGLFGGVFRRKNEPEKIPPMTPAVRPEDPFIPRGVFGVATIVVRRYLFNLWDPAPRNWAYAVRNDGKDKSGGLYAKSFYIENKMKKGRLVSVRKSKSKKNFIQSVVGGAVNGAQRTAGSVVGGVLSLFGGAVNTQNQQMDANVIDVDDILVEDDYSDDEVRIFASRLNTKASSNDNSNNNKNRQFSLRIPNLPIPTLPIPNIGKSIGRWLGGVKVALGRVPNIIPWNHDESDSNQDKSEMSSMSSETSTSSSRFDDFNSPFKLGSDSGGFVSQSGKVQVFAEDRFANRSERKDTDTRQLQTALSAVAPGEFLPPNERTPTSTSSDDTAKPSGGFNPADALIGVWSGASSVAGGAFKAIGDLRNVVNISLPSVSIPTMPWDVHYRGDIPFFENSRAASSSSDDNLNLVSRVMAVDAMMEAAASATTLSGPLLDYPDLLLPVTANTIENPITSLGMEMGASNINPSPSATIVKPKGRFSRLASSVVSNLFPLIFNGVRLVRDLNQQKANTLNSEDSDELQDIDSFYQVNPLGSTAGEVSPPQDIGLGLGLDPAYVARVRQSVESLSARESDEMAVLADTSSGTDVSDPTSVSRVSTASRVGATSEPSQSLLSTIYMYTARPIIQAPGTVYEWGRNRLMGQPGTSVDLNSTAGKTRAFDEEAEALQQELQDAVRAREVLPASVLNNDVLDKYNPVAEKQEKQKKQAPTQALTQVLLDQTKELSSVFTSPASAVISAASDAAFGRGSGSKLTSTTSVVSSVVAPTTSSVKPVPNVEKSASVDFGTLTGNVRSAASVSSRPTTTTPTTEKMKTIVSTSKQQEFVSDSSIDTSVDFSGTSTKDLRSRPQFVEKERVPIPTKADFAYIENRSVLRAISASLSIANERDAKEFLKDVGLVILLRALEEYSVNAELRDYRSDVVKGMCRLMRMEKSVADLIAQSKPTIEILVDMMEAPMRGFRSFRMSTADREKEEKSQREAVALLLRMVRSSDAATEILRNNIKLRNILSQIVAQSEIVGSSTVSIYKNDNVATVAPPSEPTSTAANLLSYVPFFSGKSAPVATASTTPKMLVRGNTTIVDYPNLKTSQMARVASWALGGVAWKPKQPGQKGLRILSLDGGGTRGVLSIALIKELMKRIGKQYPHEVFDIICGTSTGGIIACLLGLQMRSIKETETLYDDLIDRVFGKKSNLKLVSEQALYDEIEFERILYSLCGEELLLDSNRNNCARVFVASTKVNNNPPIIQLWRNYNYPPEQRPRYTGSFRINTLTAVRATTAAPTFFTPVPWNGGLYCDGALVANNPTAIALQEAKVCK